MKKFILSALLFLSAAQAYAGAHGCMPCGQCADIYERRACLATCSLEKFPTYQCRTKVVGIFKGRDENNTYLCTRNGKRYWCGTHNCTRCVPAF